MVDHVTPHRGDPVLFWQRSNLQAMCAPHHDGAKQRGETRGFGVEVDADGYPIDPQHPSRRLELGRGVEGGAGSKV